MSGNASSNNLLTNGSGFIVYNVRVWQPTAEHSSKEIRDNCLKDFFGYTEWDIKAFDNEKPGYFYVNHKNRPLSWATRQEVNGFTFNADGTVQIGMPPKLVENLVNFVVARIFNAITTAGGAISDVALRQRFIEDCDKILKFDGEVRRDALRDLMDSVTNSKLLGNGLSDALAYLSAQGYKDNPFIQIAFAKSQVGGEGGYNNALVSNLLASSIKNTAARFYSSIAGKPVTALDRQDAAYINREASYYYKQIGNEEEFQDRDWTARFYSMSQGEKADLNAGDVISLIADGPAALGTPRPDTETRSALNLAQSEYNTRRETWGNADKNTREIEISDPESSDSALLSMKTKNVVVSQVHDRKDGDKPPEQSRPNTYTSRAKAGSITLSQRSMDAGNASAAGPSLFVELAKQVTFAARMYEITKFLNRERELLRKLKTENSYVVPKRPVVIQKLIYLVMEDARKSSDPTQKLEAQKLIDRLGRNLEKSYAFYGK